MLEHDDRQMLDDGEMAWLDTQLTGDVDHLFIGTSLPFLLPPGLQHLEAFSEALTHGAWGRAGRRIGETLRQGVDLEHWGAFQESFRKVAEMVVQVAAGERGRAPRTVTFLSGDVHHSYVSEVTRLHRRDRRELQSRVLQVVCSPIRNPLPHWMRFLDRSPGVRRGRSGGRPGRPVHPRPRTAVPVVEPPRTVVRQQPGHRRRDRHGAGAVVGQGRRPQGIPAPARSTNVPRLTKVADVHIDNPLSRAPRRSPPAARWAREVPLHPEHVVPGAELPADPPPGADRLEPSARWSPSLAAFGRVIPARAVRYPRSTRLANSSS